ncbi:MAG: tetratricopeptide (TPR) repeat protein [Lentimonas sp.]|jgi:tetratricopeptide (TPR) repeat protein
MGLFGLMTLLSIAPRAQADPLHNTPAVQALAGISYDDSEVIAAAEAMSPSELKYLCYLMARLNRPRAALALAEQVFATSPEDKNTLLALASMYIERKDKERALSIAKRLDQSYPNDDQVLYFLAASHYLAGQYQEAYAILLRIKTDFYQQERFPYETDLASSAYQAGNWFRSMQAYQQLLRNHSLNDSLRQPVRNALDTIYRERMDRLQIQPSFLDQDTARSVWTASEVSRQLSDRTRGTLYFDSQYIELDANQNLIAGDSSREQVGFRIESDWTQLDSVGFGLGLAQGRGAHNITEVSLTRRFNPLRKVELGFHYNQAARDSIGLEYLDGRMHRLYARYTDSWAATYPVELTLSTRSIEANDGIELGSGTNINWTIGKHLRLVNPGLTLSYIGYYQTFTANSFRSGNTTPLTGASLSLAEQNAVWNNLVADEIHNQGLNIRLVDRFWHRWSYELNASSFYAFVQDAVEFSADARIHYYPRKSIHLYTGLNYATSAFTNSTGSFRLEWNSGLIFWF